MNSRSIFWGFFLILLGIVYLLRQMGFIGFHIDWELIWNLWPVFLIIAGLRLILPRSNQTAGALVIALLLIVFAYIIYDGYSTRFQSDDQQLSSQNFLRHHPFLNPGGQADDSTGNQVVPDSIGADSDQNLSGASYQQDFKIDDNSKIKAASLYLDGGAADFRADVTHDHLFEASIKMEKGSYKMERSTTGETEQIKLISGKSGLHGFGDEKNPNTIIVKLNPEPEWNLSLDVGAGNIKYDFTGYKVRTLKLNTGVASVDLKLGSLIPLSSVNINAGLAAFTIRIPATAGCKVQFNGAFSGKELPGFTKTGDNTWVNAAYAGSARKIDILCSGALSSLSVKSY